MALSQLQCLDDNNINLRTNESKPEFLYSEDQRLALETLIRAGQGAFEDYIKTNNIRCFLSDLELERILNTVEVYSPGSPENNNGEVYWQGDGEEISLQYWPDRSDRSIPQLDIGWPDTASYRGVTRAQVYTQPPYEGRTHIKEVVRKMIGQAQKVIAVVMDVFTDIDIFKDLLDASYRRKVAVYIMLETTGVKHFMKMCERAGMHTGHLKNLRVRCIRGAEFFSRSSKRLYGSQSQKFMFIDGDKAVSGSYSFTWSASRLDRNLITVLTGQAVDTFDTLFQDLYVLSNEVCLSKINLSSEPEPEYLPQAVPTLLPSATKALKLINPKYTLVSNCAFTTNGPVTDLTSGKNSTSKNQTEILKVTPVVPPVHPGLLNLEKANMINYIPTWPDPDPPSDVIGFINIRDANKPLQAHLMRSELFEVSQAIRFKDPVHDPEESLSLKACPGPISKTASHSEAPAQNQTSGEAQVDLNQHQISSASEDLILHLKKPETVHVLACNKVDKEELCVADKELDSNPLQSKNAHTEKDFSTAISSFAQDETKQTQENLQPLICSNQTVSNKTHLDESFATPNRHSVKQSQDDQIITDVATQHHKDTKPGWNGTEISNCDSSVSSLSDEYFECFSPEAGFRSVEDVFVSEKKPESLHNLIKNGHQRQAVLHSKSWSAQDCTDLSNNQSFFTPKLLQTSCSIIFNFLSAEFKTTADLSKTTFSQESDKGAIINDNKQAVKDSEGFCFSQTPNACLMKFSSTSDEYFECSDTVSLKSEIDMVCPSSVEKFNLNEPHGITKPILEAEKLPELSCQNIKNKDEPKMHSELEQPEFQHLLDMTADDLKTVLEPTDNIQTQLDEKAPRQVQDSEVTSEPVVESESMSNVLQQHETRSSQQFLEIQTETVSVELTENMPIQDLQPEVGIDLACEKPEKESLQSDASLKLTGEENSISYFESKVSLDVVCEEQSVKSFQNLACGESEKHLLQELQTDLSLKLISKEKPVLFAEKNPISDFESKVSLNVVCEEQSAKSLQDLQVHDLILKPSDVNISVELAEKMPMQHLKLAVSLDLMCEESEKESLKELQPDARLDLMGEEKPLLLVRKNSDLKSENRRDIESEVNQLNPDLMLKPSEVNVVPRSATECELKSSILQGIANVTSVIPEKHEVTKSTELPKSEELQMSMTHLDSSSKRQPNLRSEEDLNEHLRLQNGEVIPTVLKRNSEENNPQKKTPEQYESIELLILEDSDLRDTEQNHSDPIRPPAVLSKETKMSQTEPVQPKSTIDRKLTQNKMGHDVYSGNGKETCYPTVPVEEKQEEEHICTNPMNKNPKMERLAKKKSLQASSRIPIQARRGSTKSPMIKPDTISLSSGLQAPKAGMHKHPLGKAVGQNKTSITPPSSPEKLSTGGITPVRSTQIPQRPTWTVPTPNSPTSPTKQPQVQLTAPRIRPLDQPNVSRKRSVSITKYSCSSSGNSCPGKVKKQAVKGSLPNP